MWEWLIHLLLFRTGYARDCESCLVFLSGKDQWFSEDIMVVSALCDADTLHDTKHL